MEKYPATLVLILQKGDDCPALTKKGFLAILNYMLIKPYFSKFFLFIACILAGSQSVLLAQPVAAFTSNVTQGCTPVEVQFSDQSTVNPTNWFWDFGDGTTSTLKNPLKTFSAIGNFSITLTVSNALGSSNVTKPNLITVKPVPTSQFSATPLTGCFPLTVNFSDLSFNSAGGPIVAWYWAFGDGTFNNTQNPIHTYSDFGDYDVSLYVENTSGCAAYLSKGAYVKVGDTVKADFDTTMQPYCKLPKIVNFSNATAGSGTFTYSWDFGDGTFSNLPNPTHNYNRFGIFNVTLTATSSYGCSDILVKRNFVIVDSIITDFSIPANSCTNNQVPIVNLSAPSNIKSIWTFGDSTGSVLFNPVKQYAAPGNFSIKLKNRFGNGCIDSLTKNINILNNPTIAFSVSQPSGACKPPLTVTFTDATPGAASRIWNFGDGISATGSPVTHTYTASGTFAVKLIVTNANGCKDSLTKPSLIVISPPKASIVLSEPGGCVPATLSPVASVSSAEPVTGYSWDFGDGFTTNVINPTHTYTTIGIYIMKLIITSAGGCKDTTSQIIRIGDQPVIGFTIAPNPICARKAINFTDTSPLGTAVFWDFGDGNSVAAKSPVYKYNLPGTYSIRMRVDNGGCNRDTFLNNYVTVLPPASGFNFSQDCSNKFLFSFDASSTIGGNSFKWDFGDGFTSTGGTATHNYAAKGNYVVSLIATNNSCTDTLQKTIIAGLTSTTLRANNTTPCKNNNVIFTAHYETPAYVDNYEWDFGDGTSTVVTDSITQHTYAGSGAYTIRLIVSNIFGCLDTVISQNYIKVSGPVAAFGAVNSSGCTGKRITFIDSSTTDGIHPIVSWKWDFGDGSVQTFAAPPFTHTYTTNGTFSVKLLVTDNIGCRDTVTRVNFVNNSLPIINFSTQDTISCPMAPVRLIASGQGDSLRYTWNTGVVLLSGDTAIARYTDSGRYTIKMYVTDVNGCMDSVIKASYISIKKPSASFTMSDSISICPPLKVRFISKSYYYNRTIWDFDNGNSSFQQNPYVAFDAGTFNVKLKVISPGGCADSMIKPVQVYPNTNQFTYQPIAGCQPLAVTFRLYTPSKGTYKWDFNDGTTINTVDTFVVKKYTSFGPYQPRVFFTENGTGCILQVGGGAVINVVGTIAKFALSDSVFCGSGTVNFSDSSISTGPMSFHWIFGDGTFSNIQNPTHTYTSPGRYTVQEIVSSGNCSDTFTKQNAVIIHPDPKVFIIGDSVGCQPFNTTLTTRLVQPDSAMIAYSWDFGNGQTSAIKNPPQQVYPSAGTFNVKLKTTSSNGCISDTSKQIIVNPLPVINAGNDTTVCANTPVTLRPSGANSYTWLPPTNNQLSCINCTNPVATLASPSEWYYVQGATQFGCQAKDSVHIKYLPAYSVSAAPLSDSICIGQSVQLSATGAQLYSWSPATGLSSSTIGNPKATPTVSTTYKLVATDTLGCQTFTRDIPIIVFPYPTVNAGPDVTISGGSSTRIIANASADAILYRWMPASQLSCTDCLSPLATPKATTNYILTVSNGGQCSASDSILITVLCNNTNVFIPNTFSPNGDGVNDVFYPRGTGLYSIKSLRIFGRWGEMVFGRTNMVPNDKSQGWDGNYKGSRASTDVYTYIAEIYCENNTLITINGTINLIY